MLMNNDDRIDDILLRLARKSLRSTPEQHKSLALLAYLSKTLRFVQMGESSSDYAVWVRVEVDGGREVDVDQDGGLELFPGRVPGGS